MLKTFSALAHTALSLTSLFVVCQVITGWSNGVGINWGSINDIAYVLFIVMTVSVVYKGTMEVYDFIEEYNTDSSYKAVWVWLKYWAVYASVAATCFVLLTIGNVIW